MPQNRPADVNALAARIVAEAVGDEPRTDPPVEPDATAEEGAFPPVR